MYSVDTELLREADKSIQEMRKTNVRLKKYINSDEYVYIQKCKKWKVKIEPLIKSLENIESEIKKRLDK